MKNIKIIGVLCTALIPFLWTGCVKEINQLDQEKENLHEVVFHAGWDAETKTVLQEDGSVFWSPGDEISLFVVEDCGDGSESVYGGQGGWCLSSTNEGDAAKTEFVGEIENVRNVNKYIAIYPYSETNEALGSAFIGFTIPTVQTAVRGTFSPNSFVSCAVSTDDHLYFKNLCGGIKFSVSQSGIKEVSFRYTGGNAMSGNLLVPPDNSTFLWSYNTKSDEVIVRSPDESGFKVGEFYYASVFPYEGPEPVMVTYKKESEAATYLTTGQTSIKPSVIKRLYEKDKGLTFVPRKDGAVLMSRLPFELEDKKDKITEVHFNPSSSRVTEINLGTEDKPVYFEMDGTIVNYYTPKPSFILRDVTHAMFNGYTSLTTVDFTGVDTSEATDFYMFFAGCGKLANVDLSSFDTGNVSNMAFMFSSCVALEKLDLSSFDTRRVTDMSMMFHSCINLKSLDISSFSAESCNNMNFFLTYCGSLRRLDMAGFDISKVPNISEMCFSLAIHRKDCVVRAPDGTRNAMCETNSGMSYSTKQYFIRWINQDEEFPEMTDRFAHLYKSTDYSKDKTSALIHSASKGKGIDIVIMGDAYSDRLINDGTYDRDMSAAIDHIFSEEPLKSMKEYFNIYIAYAVSENEEYNAVTALDLIFEGGSRVDGGGLVDWYMASTLPNYGWRLSASYPIIISNCHFHAGTANFYNSEATLVLTTLGENDDDFHHLVCHEFGHAIALLADEYAENTLTYNNVDGFIRDSSKGFYPNVDITNNPNDVKWNRFLKDERYSGQGLGVYEGGMASYMFGIWRPTDNSIMRSATRGFNAPSREAIYKRVHTLADDSFVYDYETFVEQDIKSYSTMSTQSLRSVSSASISKRRPEIKMEKHVTMRGEENVIVFVD